MRPDLDVIKARAEAATPGPWHAEQVGDFHSDRERDWMIADVLRWCGEDATMANALSFDVDGRTAKFVAHARQDIPDLLAYIEELETARASEVSE